MGVQLLSEVGKIGIALKFYFGHPKCLQTQKFGYKKTKKKEYIGDDLVATLAWKSGDGSDDSPQREREKRDLVRKSLRSKESCLGAVVLAQW